MPGLVSSTGDVGINMLNLANAKVRIYLDMANFSSENRRPSTVIRQNTVHEVYCELIKELGEYAFLVPKSFIYSKINERTGLCVKTIAYVLNHTEYVE